MRLVVWAVLVTGVVGLVGAVGARFEAPPSVGPVRPRPAPSAPLPPYRPDSLALAIVSRDLFRIGRRPSPVVYDPMRDLQAAQIVAGPPKPLLLLVGVVAGREPSAVIEGFPGVEGARVVRIGDEASGLRVVEIAEQRVRIVGMDTVWVLRVREPWK